MSRGRSTIVAVGALSAVVSAAIGCSFPDVDVVSTPPDSGTTTTTSATGSGGSSGDGGSTTSSTTTSGAGGAGGAGGSNPCDKDGDGHLSRDCVGDDCDDDDVLVHPDQPTKWFETPSKHMGFDYDCSHEEEQEFLTAGCSGAICSDATGVYLSLVPVGCGLDAAWGDCSLVLCSADVKTTKTVRCH